jgi:eukaryotic translation initiation factor 2C
MSHSSITYIACGKRHHISIFPVDNLAKEARTDNAKAGIVIDVRPSSSRCCEAVPVPPLTRIATPQNVITSPFTFDFYLQSHASLLGTSRSSHYTILADDSGFDADELQALCYSM